MENGQALETVSVSRAYLNAQSEKIKNLEAEIAKLKALVKLPGDTQKVADVRATE